VISPEYSFRGRTVRDDDVAPGGADPGPVVPLRARGRRIDDRRALEPGIGAVDFAAEDDVPVVTVKKNCWPSFFECLAQLRLVDVAHFARTIQGSEVHTPMIGGEIGADLERKHMPGLSRAQSPPSKDDCSWLRLLKNPVERIVAA
jgi:hypothetical protein